MARVSIYHVWRRGDGYVAATKGEAQPKSRGDRPIDQFTAILSTEDWAETRKAIEANRDARHEACVASWFHATSWVPETNY